MEDYGSILENLNHNQLQIHFQLQSRHSQYDTFLLQPQA